MMQSFRVTKYNPINRNLQGVYCADDWTSSSDIGDSFNGEKLTLQDYLTKENDYIDSIVELLNTAKINRLTLIEFEDYREGDGLEYRTIFKDSLYETNFHQDQVVSIELLPDVIKLSLREQIWCRLHSQECFVHFGHDLYCYVGLPDGVQIDSVGANGIYIEKFDSPYI